jgi:hypothetical protein
MKKKHTNSFRQDPILLGPVAQHDLSSLDPANNRT